MERYEKYKDSGVEWIGEVPEHWEVSFVKRFSKITDGSHFSPQTRDIGLPYVSVKDIGINQIDLTNCKRISEDDFNALVKNGCLPKVGDVLLTKDGTIGRAAVVYQNYAPFVVLSSLGIISPGHKIFPDYLYFYLISGINVDQMYSLIHGSALTRLTIEKINSLIIAVPSFEEQTTIASYLERKTAEIDQLIADKKRLITLYEEEKTALINQAVTKGINPEVKMKDSGIEWLGEVPESWEVKKLKHVSKKIGDGIHSTPNYLINTEFHFINGVNLSNGRILLTDKTMSVSKEEYEKYKIDLDKNTILISLNGTIGKLAIYNDELVILGKSAAFISLQNSICPIFIYYILQSEYINNYFEDSFSGTTIKNLSLYTLRNTPLSFPTLEQQKIIVKHIKKECSLFDAKIAKTQKLIDLLSEYRTALISEVVTGKVRVT
ncbi:restriction endonuclease subunit S [Haliscomenobacter sp.]|uniref:restriction endonuclease subunit S n=1 Tax=Haliscomenobacter sp. TaxID=2717303 RepID=UPI0035936113